MAAAQADIQKTQSEAEENQAQAALYQVRAGKEAVTPIQPPAMPGMASQPRPASATQPMR